MAERPSGQAPQPMPTPAEIKEMAREALMPALVWGLVNAAGPIDDEDRVSARQILEITSSRVAFASYLRQKAVGSALNLALSIAEGRDMLLSDLVGPTEDAIRRHLKQISVPSGSDDITDEVWAYAQKRRAYAESILAGVLPRGAGG